MYVINYQLIFVESEKVYMSFIYYYKEKDNAVFRFRELYMNALNRYEIEGDVLDDNTTEFSRILPETVSIDGKPKELLQIKINMKQIAWEDKNKMSGQEFYDLINQTKSEIESLKKSIQENTELLSTKEKDLLKW